MVLYSSLAASGRLFDSMAGLIVNRRCWLRRFANLQRDASKRKLYEIKLSSKVIRRVRARQERHAKTKHELIRGNRSVQLQRWASYTVLAKRGARAARRAATSLASRPSPTWRLRQVLSPAPFIEKTWRAKDTVPVLGERRQAQG
jgi:hypothetical protein